MHILKKKICKIIVFSNTDFEVLPVCRLSLNRPSGALSGLLELLQWSQLSFQLKYLSTTTSLVVIFLKRNHKILRRFWPQTMEFVWLIIWLEWAQYLLSSKVCPLWKYKILHNTPTASAHNQLSFFRRKKRTFPILFFQIIPFDFEWLCLKQNRIWS